MDGYIKEIEKLLHFCGEIILNADRKSMETDEKSGHANFVTEYDKKIQAILKTELLKILPEAVFVGEEEEIHKSIEKGMAFIVDPIDGTTNFMKDYHMSAISVGITKNGEPYAGVIYNPYLNEMFTAQKSCGAYLNGKQIHVSKKELKNGITLFGTSPYYEDLAEETFHQAYKYFKMCADVRRSGSAALD